MFKKSKETRVAHRGGPTRGNNCLSWTQSTVSYKYVIWHVKIVFRIIRALLLKTYVYSGNCRIPWRRSDFVPRRVVYRPTQRFPLKTPKCECLSPLFFYVSLQRPCRTVLPPLSPKPSSRATFMRVDCSYVVRVHNLPLQIFRLHARGITDLSVSQNQRWVGSFAHKGARTLSYVHTYVIHRHIIYLYAPDD
jgi:hypothetical protein